MIKVYVSNSYSAPSNAKEHIMRILRNYDVEIHTWSSILGRTMNRSAEEVLQFIDEQIEAVVLIPPTLGFNSEYDECHIGSGQYKELCAFTQHTSINKVFVVAHASGYDEDSETIYAYESEGLDFIGESSKDRYGLITTSSVDINIENYTFDNGSWIFPLGKIAGYDVSPDTAKTIKHDGWHAPHLSLLSLIP